MFDSRSEIPQNKIRTSPLKQPPKRRRFMDNDLQKMKFSSILLPLGGFLLLFAGCSKPETNIEMTYDVSITWRAGQSEGVIFDQTYTVSGDRKLASDAKNEFQLSNFSEQLIPTAYALNKEFNTEVNGVEITVGNIEASSENGVKFPEARMLTFYEPPNQPRIEIHIKIKERK
jgi:hypothetical protein